MTNGTPRAAGDPAADGGNEQPFEAIEETFKLAVEALGDAEIPFLLGGSIAAWALGGTETRNDLDLMIKAEDADAAVAALENRGMRPDDPPEPWLTKVYNGDVLIDLIHHPMGIEITDEVIERGLERDVSAMRVRVMAPEDILVSKLLALGEHALDLEPALQLTRSLREQIDWENVCPRVEGSPYAAAFLTLARELELCPARGEPARRADRPTVRVLDAPMEAG